MPMDRKRYPINWKEIALQVKERANWICEKCKKQCRKPNERFDTHARTLTVAHINHVPEDCSESNLIALCAGCHLHYDQPRRQLQKIVKARTIEQLKERE